jgi:hypothetical protein
MRTDLMHLDEYGTAIHSYSSRTICFDVALVMAGIQRPAKELDFIELYPTYTTPERYTQYFTLKVCKESNTVYLWGKF